MTSTITTDGRATSAVPEVLARLDHVTRRFGDTVALDDVSLEITAGSIVGLLGPNGAGKSTLLSLLDGRRRPTAGTVELFGGRPDDPASRQRLGCTPQETGLPETLRVSEVLDFVGAHFDDATDTATIVREFGLEPVLRAQTGALSGGQKRRLAVALAFIGNPRLVLLDEPTTGLDVDARHTLWAALRRQHERGATIVVTSHYLEEIEALAERVVVIGAGRVLADDSLEAIVGRVGMRTVSFASIDVDRAGSLPGVLRHERSGSGATLWVSDSDDFIRELVGSGLPFDGLSVRGATLEEAFIAVTDGTGSPPPGQLPTPASATERTAS